MRKLLVEGGNPLKGTVRISGAKNSVLKLMAASLLGTGKFEIGDVPAIKDVYTMIGVLESLGVKAKLIDSKLTLEVGELTGVTPTDLVQEMRASIQVMGPLLARLGWVRITKPGGCAIGDRPIDLHLKNLRKLGADIQEEHCIKAVMLKVRSTDANLKHVISNSQFHFGYVYIAEMED